MMRFIFLTDKSTFRALSLDRRRTVDFWRLLNDVDGFASSVLDSLLDHWWIGHLCFLGLLGIDCGIAFLLDHGGLPLLVRLH